MASPSPSLFINVSGKEDIIAASLSSLFTTRYCRNRNCHHRLQCCRKSIMKHDTWPTKSGSPCFTSLPLMSKHQTRHHRSYEPDSQFPITPYTPRPPPPRFNKPQVKPFSSSSKSQVVYPHNHQFRDFSSLPYDVLSKIAANFTLPNLRAASLVCTSWRDALRPLREAMLFLRWGKRFKHGRGGVNRNLTKALDSFLKGAERGSTLAMVDAGLLYWEMGRKEEGIALYRRAAELGDHDAQSNLGISYLQVDPPNFVEALRWLYEAAFAGHVRAQYQLALCLRQGSGLDPNIREAARWYLRAAEAGYVRAMYNTSLCYSYGEGLAQSHRLARKWMKRAADRGHSKAQFEHGLGLFSEGEMMKALIYLELASRAGETGATHVRNAILQQLSPTSRDQAMQLVDNWRALPGCRRIE